MPVIETPSIERRHDDCAKTRKADLPGMIMAGENRQGTESVPVINIVGRMRKDEQDVDGMFLERLFLQSAPGAFVAAQQELCCAAQWNPHFVIVQQLEAGLRDDFGYFLRSSPVVVIPEDSISAQWRVKTFQGLGNK